MNDAPLNEAALDDLVRWLAEMLADEAEAEATVADQAAQ